MRVIETINGNRFCRDNGGRTSLIDIIRTAYVISE
jgi:hypothetical protein